VRIQGRIERKFRVLLPIHYSSKYFPVFERERLVRREGERKEKGERKRNEEIAIARNKGPHPTERSS